jgi:hypothetical protein
MMDDPRLATMHDVALYIAEANDATYEREHELREKACAACEVTADWQDCLDAFDSRSVGGFVADWSDEAEYHPHESSGAAVVDIGDGNSVVAYWSDAGFWNVDIMPEDHARRALEDLAANWYVDEEEEAE